MSTSGSSGGGLVVRLLAGMVSATAAETLGSWAARAACADTDPEIFFPPSADPGTRARQICHRCPVRQECLDYAVTADEKYGIWGGLDPDERKNLRRKLRRARSQERAGKGVA